MITPERARQIIVAHERSFGSDISDCMTTVEEAEVRQHWLRTMPGNTTFRDAVYRIARS
jgi:hypothetical protein